jgi:hypothetical protein
LEFATESYDQENLRRARRQAFTGSEPAPSINSIPEGILQPGWRHGLVCSRLRVELVRDFLIDETGRGRYDLVFIIPLRET